jgi:hypothetical protein
MLCFDTCSSTFDSLDADWLIENMNTYSYTKQDVVSMLLSPQNNINMKKETTNF